MENRTGKESNDSNQVILPKAKRRRAPDEEFPSNAACAALNMCNLPPEKVGKQQKLDGFNGESVHCARVFQNSIVRNYSNFMKSGMPQRMLFHQDGEWTDFPQNLVTLIKEDLQMKRTAVEVELNGYSFLLDFLHMSCVDLKTGSQQLIAWIDEAGSCFFPENFAADCCNHHCGEHEEHLDRDLSVPRELKLQLEIDINGGDLKECYGDSNAFEDNMQNDQKPTDNQLLVAVEGGEGGCEGFPDQKNTDTAEVNQQVKANTSPMVKPTEEELDPEFVQKMFLMNMISFAVVDIVDLQQCPSPVGQERFELFKKQAEIMEKLRGDANVRYAWLPASSGVLSSIMTSGIGACGPLTNKSTYGIGVHLSSVNWPHISVKYCDVNEDGVRHVVFCRVIMGHMECLPLGSRQSHPSRMEFDSGVDDILNPAHYTVWTMNANTHIYPEYVIGFKLPVEAEGNLSGRRFEIVSDAAITLRGPILHPGNNGEPDSDNEDSQGRASTVSSNAPGVPRSPWLPFPMLFDAISDKISARKMAIIRSNYNLFKAKEITRVQFVMRLRAIVGDNLLRSTITGLHFRAPADRELQVVGQNAGH